MITPIFKTIILSSVFLSLLACVPPPPPPSTVVVRDVVQGEIVTGDAIWYGELYHGRRTDSGEQFDMRLLTGSHTTIPFGSRVEIINPETGKSVLIVINDRSHLDGGIHLAISKAAAKKLGVVDRRRFQVKYRWME